MSDIAAVRITTGGARSITISYLVYGREMSVRTNWIDGSFAALNGAPTFISMVGGTARPHEVRVELPEAATRSFGAAKRAVYEESLRPGPIEECPVRAVVQQDAVPVNVFWAP